MNTRLKQFIAAENISQAQLADKINVVRASVSHILAGRNKPGYEFISGLMQHYPNLNMEWLILGKGKMYKDQRQEPVQVSEPEVRPAAEDEKMYTDLFGHYQEGQEEEEEISVQSPTPAVPSVSLSDIKTLISASQKPINQRKLIKITAFFDDGTFQELTSI